MTYKELLETVTFAEIAPFIKKYHGDESALDSYRQHYDVLKSFRPRKEPGHEYATISNDYPNENRDTLRLDVYPMKGDSWEVNLAKELRIEDDVKAPLAEIAACCLWRTKIDIIEDIRRRPHLYTSSSYGITRKEYYNLIDKVMVFLLELCYHNTTNEITVNITSNDTVVFSLVLADEDEFLHKLKDEFVLGIDGRYVNHELFIVRALCQKTTVCVKNEASGHYRKLSFEKGILNEETIVKQEDNRVSLEITPDSSIFKTVNFKIDYVEAVLKRYTYLSPNTVIVLNGKQLHSPEGMEDLLYDSISIYGLYHSSWLYYPVVHLADNEIDIAFTHGYHKYYKENLSFVNYYTTPNGGTHLNALKKSLRNVLSQYLRVQENKKIILKGLIIAIKVKVLNPIFVESTRRTLGSRRMNDPCEYCIDEKNIDYIYLDKYIEDFIKNNLPHYLDKHPQTVEEMKRLWH